jgi:hypothetical protein
VDGGTGPATATTRLTYPAGEQAAAQTVAAALGLPAGALSATGTSTSLVLDIGRDWSTGTAMASATPPTGPVALPSNASAINASAPPGCVQVSTQDTTQFGSPVRAYARNPQIPDSDSPAARQL